MFFTFSEMNSIVLQDHIVEIDYHFIDVFGTNFVEEQGWCGWKGAGSEAGHAHRRVQGWRKESKERSGENNGAAGGRAEKAQGRAQGSRGEGSRGEGRAQGR